MTILGGGRGLGRAGGLVWSIPDPQPLAIEGPPPTPRPTPAPQVLKSIVTTIV